MIARQVTFSVLALPATTIVMAAPVGNTFQVSATIINSCTVTGTTLNFGSAIDPLATSAPVDASSALTLTCTNTTPYTVALSAGVNAGGASNFGSRVMKSGGNTLAYQIYLDPARSNVWGDGSAGSGTVTGTGTGNAQTINVYGRIASLAHVVPGAYSDTVTLTISY